MTIQRRDSCVWMDPDGSRKCHESEMNFDRQVGLTEAEGRMGLCQAREPEIGRGQAGEHSLHVFQEAGDYGR